MGFVKLDCAIVDSSLWVERDHRSLFITALVMAEPFELETDTPQIEVDTLEPTGWVVPKGWYGRVEAAGTGIIRRDGLTMEEGKVALRALCAPDPHSRSQDFDGRRLARIDGGYIVLNYFKYRDRDYGAADRMRKLRERRKQKLTNVNVTANSDGVTANITQAEDRGQKAEDREQSSESSSSSPSALEEVLAHAPNRLAWEASLRMAQDGARGAHMKATAAQVEEAALEYLAGNHHKGDRPPNLKHFLAFVERTVAGEAHPKPRTARATSVEKTRAALDSV